MTNNQARLVSGLQDYLSSEKSVNVMHHIEMIKYTENT